MKKYTIILALSGLLIACGDNNDSQQITKPPITEPPINSKSTITGTAAAGAPIIGQVIITDIKGQTKTVKISETGAYSIDVTDMQKPFILKAEGYVAGEFVELCSASFNEKPTNPIINITPYTDLILANAAGSKISNCAYGDFLKQSNATTKIGQSQDILKAQLVEILKEINLPNPDFFHDKFQADHTGLDELLDAVQVILDSETQIAVLKDVINNTRVEDDLRNPSDQTALPVPIRKIKGIGSSLKSISGQLHLFSSYFVNSIPQAGQIRIYFAEDKDFLQAGQNIDEFLDDVLGNPDNKGLKFQSPRIVASNDNNELTIRVQLANGDTVYGYEDFVFAKSGTRWLNKGNQRYIDQVLESVNSRTLTNKKFYIYSDEKTHAPKAVFSRHLEIGASNVPEEVTAILVTHPALSTTVKLQRVSGYIDWGISTIQENGEIDVTSWINECSGEITTTPCINFNQVKPDSEFKFSPIGKDGITTVLDDRGRNILQPYTMNLLNTPFSNTAAQKNSQWFSSVTSINPSDPAALKNGVPVSIKVTRPTAKGYIFDYMSAGTSSTRGDDDMRPNKSNTINFTWNFGSVQSDSDIGTKTAFFNFWSRGPGDRTFVTRTLLHKE